MSRFKVTTIAAVWLSIICSAFAMLMHYEGDAGAQPKSACPWPTDARLALSPDGNMDTLIMCVHPQCPCSASSLNELDVLLARRKNIRAYVLFVRPVEFAPGWEKTDLWQRALEIPGVVPICDEGGRLCDQLMAGTSGDTFLFDGKGRLLFEGGITASRGHEGDNQGLSTIEALAQGLPVRQCQTPVFGCSLK